MEAMWNAERGRGAILATSPLFAGRQARLAKASAQGAAAAEEPPAEERTPRRPPRPSLNALPTHLQAQWAAKIATEENAFDERQKERSSAWDKAKDRPHSPRAHRNFAQIAFECSSNRALPPPRPEVPKEHGPRKRYPKERPKTPPKLVVAEPPKPRIKDVWKPRSKWCDAKSVYDTDIVEAKRFEVDWERAIDLGLARLIMKRDDDGGTDDDGDGISDEVEEVKDVLWDCHDMIVQLFDFYACASGDMDSIGLNQWSEFVEDFDLDESGSKFCRKSDLDTLFIAVNAASKMSDANSNAKMKDDSKSLNRVEFMVCLVNVAIMKLVLTGAFGDVSEALHVLLVERVLPLVDEQTFCARNARTRARLEPVHIRARLEPVHILPYS